MLEQQVKAIELQLDATRKRLENLRKTSSTELSQQAQPYYPVAPFSYPSMPFGTLTPEEELASLEDYKKNLDEEVKGVEARIEELKKLIDQKKAST
jgi:predicted  nucleic acid-binding Zn-ribbon protein